LEIFVFIFFLLLCCFGVSKIPFLKKSGLSKSVLIGLFLLKVVAGLGYAYFYKLPRYYATADTYRFYKLSLTETKWLKSDPVGFFKDIFSYGYSSSGNIFSGHNSYWNDLKSNIPVKLMAFTNVLTNNSYYTNIILFNFLFFIGIIALFRLFKAVYGSSDWLLIGGIFLLPSTLFWCSGVHKDGLILSAAGLLFYCVYKIFIKGIKSKYLLTIIGCAILIFGLRNYVVLAMIPALFAWGLAIGYPNRSSPIYVGITAVCILLFIGSFYVQEPIHIPSYIANKQHEFQQLSGASAVNVKPLAPTLESFILYLPSAIDMAVLRPHITEARHVSYIPAALENVLVILLLIITIIRWRKTKSSIHTGFFLLFAFTILIIAGYTITFSGAIVRYRSFALPFVITPLLCCLVKRKIVDQI
jgi:hypothetical protein